MPASVFITEIEDPGKYPVAGGGYSDVFRATLKTTPVALKRLRIFLHSAAAGDAYHVCQRDSATEPDNRPDK